MAESPAPPDPTPHQAEPDNPIPQPVSTSPQLPPPPQHQQSVSPLNPNPNPVPIPIPNQNPIIVSPSPPLFPGYVTPQISGPPGAVLPGPPSFRPVPQFSPLNYQHATVQSPGMQPPGVSGAQVMAPGGAVSGAVAVSVPPPPPQLMAYNPALRQYAPMPNGYAPPQVTMPPPGLPRYPSPYPAMVRPLFPPRPPGAIGVLPAVSRPLVPGIPGVRPITPPLMRPPIIPMVTPAEKPQTTVYVGKIAPTVENDFMLSLLKYCGPVKSWKRAQDPTDGTPRGFGFCEFESAEAVLRALRLLSKFNIDGQELVLNVNQATRDYLERYVTKETEKLEKMKENEGAEVEKENGSAQSGENESPKSSLEDSKNDDGMGKKVNHDITSFGIVTDEDKEADQEALEKLRSIIEERLKTRPLPPPPAQLAVTDVSGNINTDLPAKSRDGDSDADIVKNDAVEDKNDDETTSDNKTSDHDRPETSSPDRSRRYDRRSRDKDRDKERDLKRDKEREIERYEREAERERVRKERDQRRKIEDAERAYEECLKEWEYRERDKEKQRLYEKEKEKERERKRKREVVYDEDDDEEDSRKRWRRSAIDEKRKRRVREKEEDMADRLKEEEELAEAKKRAKEEQLQQQQTDTLKPVSDLVKNENEKAVIAEESRVENTDKDVEQHYHVDSGHENHLTDNGASDEITMVAVAASDTRQSSNGPAKKLGFGLVGSGKRTAVPSVFHEEDDDEVHKDKKMRPLVPIDYSTEELQAVQPTLSGAPQPNLAAAAEFAKRISNVNSKEEKPDAERERSRRLHDRSSQREKDRNDENRTRDENKEKISDRDRDREHRLDTVKTPDTKKLLDAKQLIDMIPKTKEELFSYEINWTVYDKHELHERMRPWISKKITEFLGEEETTLIDYIVNSTREHMKASEMLEQLQSILDDEAEMFVLKMWRMLIFEIKKVETGLSLRSRG